MHAALLLTALYLAVALCTDPLALRRPARR